MRSLAVIVAVLFALFSSSVAFADDVIPPYTDLLPNTPRGWDTVKKRLFGKVYFDHEITLYCACAYENKDPDLASCGLDGVVTGLLSEQTHAEHIVPASAFGRTRDCWAAGGRSNCKKEDEIFLIFHNDLHNVAPALGTTNIARSDYSMGFLEGEATDYGTCDFEVSNEDDMVEPMPSIRGDIARTYFYVEWLYGLRIEDGQRILFHAWNQSDPVDEFERTRNDRIEELQGNRNPFVH